MQWFRWYHGTCSDPKMGSVARRAGVTRERVIAVWAMLLESASEADERGRIDVDAEGIADCLNCDTESIDRILAAMQERKMIERGAVAKWEERQRPTDSSAERVKRHRQRRKKGGGNVTETVTPKTVTAPEVEVEKETDTDTTTIIKMRGRVSVDHERDAGRIIVAANAGMKANPALPNAKPIPPGHGSRQTVLDWLADGIPPDFAAVEVEGRARDYRPGSPGDQIHSMNYFDKPVREAWRNDQTGVSDGTDDRGTGKEARGAKPSRFAAHVIDGGPSAAA
jgi:hypothetical protein